MSLPESSKKFVSLGKDMPDRFEPIVEELRPAPDPKKALRRFSLQEHCLFLDSALHDERLGRYSFLTADPYDYFESPADGSDALRRLSQRLEKFHSTAIAGLPPFQGGAAGLFSYDLAHSLEEVPRHSFDEFKTPALAIGLYDIVLAWDHLEDRAWIISQGFPELQPQRRRQRAARRLRQFKERLLEREDHAPQAIKNNSESVQILAPQSLMDGFPGLSSNFSSAEYHQTVEKAIEYIFAGDIFQVNLAQRLLHRQEDSSLELYLRMRERNPATFAGYFVADDFQIISASPERFLNIRDGHVESRPIKGTRQRTTLPEADLFTGDQLLNSEKDRAENVMIVDLMRNDLSRVCRSESVCVTQLCELEMYQTVQHLVSSVCGRLVDDATPIDLLRAAFPGGSITGAPKVRAMEIISELEPTSRGPYCGSLGYLGFDGTLDISILIRTITSGRGWWQIPVGGGIVAQSIPRQEYEETWHKAAGMLRSLKE